MKGNWDHCRHTNKPRKRETEGYMILYISYTSKIMHARNSSDNFGARSLCSANRPKSIQFINWFIWCANTKWRRGTTVLGFCLHFTLTCFPRNSNPTCCPDQLSALKMHIPSPWTGLWNNNRGPMRQNLWQQCPLNILLLNSVFMTHHAAPLMLGTRPENWSSLWNPLSTTTSTIFCPCLVLWHWVMSPVLQNWISADPVT